MVIFTCAYTLHRVAPTYAERFALTAWWFAGPPALEARSGSRSSRGEHGRRKHVRITCEWPQGLLGRIADCRTPRVARGEQ